MEQENNNLADQEPGRRTAMTDQPDPAKLLADYVEARREMVKLSINPPRCPRERATSAEALRYGLKVGGLLAAIIVGLSAWAWLG